MRKINLYTSLFLILLALAICASSMKLSLYGHRGPGPGFMGFGTGSVLFLLSFHLFLKNLFSYEKERPKSQTLKNVGTNFSILISLIFYAVFLERLGFLLDLFIVLLFLFALSKKMRWYTVFVSSLFVSLGSYILFSQLLGIGLPGGVLNFIR